MQALWTLAFAVALFQQPSARIEGTVADATNGPPLRDAQVLLAIGSEANTRAVVTDAAGTFSFDDVATGKGYGIDSDPPVQKRGERQLYLLTGFPVAKLLPVGRDQ